MQPRIPALQKLRQAHQGKLDPPVDEFDWLMQELKATAIISVRRLEKMAGALRNS